MCCLSYENDQYTREKRSQPKEAPKKEELGAIRDKMESKGKDAADVIVKKEEGRGRGRRERRPREDRPPRDAAQAKPESTPATPAADTGTPTTEAKSTDENSDQPRKRRRRRRRN